MLIKKLKNFRKNKIISKYDIPSVEQSLKHLKSLGFNPKTIFDVGAYKGDFATLSKNVWKNTHIVCFEPLSEKVVLLNNLAQKEKKIKIIEGIVGEKERKVIFNESETASSCLSEHIDQKFPTSKKEMNTLVNYIKKYNLEIPNMLKIDTQGYEYQVLKGTIDVIDKIDVILAELNLIDIHKNVYLAADVIKLLNRHNFVLFDIAEIHRRPLDRSVWQTDFVFVKKDSLFRKNKAWK